MPNEKTKIWCLFSVDNNYDQPPNNLVGWWESKPDFNSLAGMVGLKQFPCDTDEGTLYVVNLWQGQGGRAPHDDTDYRLKEIGPGRVK